MLKENMFLLKKCKTDWSLFPLGKAYIRIISFAHFFVEMEISY